MSGTVCGLEFALHVHASVNVRDVPPHESNMHHFLLIRGLLVTRVQGGQIRCHGGHKDRCASPVDPGRLMTPISGQRGSLHRTARPKYTPL